MAEYINKEAVRDALYEADAILMSGLKILNQFPAADVAPVRHGRWILVDTDEEQFFICSDCENKEYWESDYCPKCGAKMDGGESDARNPIPREADGQRSVGAWKFLHGRT